MSGDPKLDKQTAAGTVPPPRMLGDTDVSLILSFAEKLPEGAHILEVGPWLGGLTVDLASYGHVTVVDRFIWSDANARNYPGIAEPDTSFRSAFEANMAAQGLDVDVIESTLPDMLWEGGALDFMVIDAPRDAKTLHGCLRAVAVSLKPGAIIVIKHALTPSDFGMGAYLDALAGQGHARIEATQQADWCNIATVTVLESFGELADVQEAEDLIAMAPMSNDFTDPWYGRRLSAYRLGFLARASRWNAAYARLSEMPKDPENLKWWDAIEKRIYAESPEESHANLAMLSELVWIHNNAHYMQKLPVVPTADVSALLTAYWRNNSGKPWVYDRLDARLLCNEKVGQATSQLAAYAGQIFKGRVLEIGRNLGATALSSLVYGAEHYSGIELGSPTELGVAAAACYPHVKLTTKTDVNLCEIAEATVLVIAEEPQEGSAVADALRARIDEDQTKITVIYRTRQI